MGHAGAAAVALVVSSMLPVTILRQARTRSPLEQEARQELATPTVSMGSRVLLVPCLVRAVLERQQKQPYQQRLFPLGLLAVVAAATCKPLVAQEHRDLGTMVELRSPVLQ